MRLAIAGATRSDLFKSLSLYVVGFELSCGARKGIIETRKKEKGEEREREREGETGTEKEKQKEKDNRMKWRDVN